MTPTQPIRETNSPINMFSSNTLNTNTTTTTNNNNFFTQSFPQLIPTPVKTPTQSPIPIKKLSLNPPKKTNDTVTDLLDFGDPSPPPPPPDSPKFDPYA